MGNSKKEIQKLLSEADAFFERGNFSRARKLYKEILSLDTNQETKEKTLAMLKNLSVDGTQLVIGALAFLLLALLYVWFGLLK